VACGRLRAGEAVAQLELVELVYEGVQAVEVGGAVDGPSCRYSSASSVSLEPRTPWRTRRWDLPRLLLDGYDPSVIVKRSLLPSPQEPLRWAAQCSTVRGWAR